MAWLLKKIIILYQHLPLHSHSKCRFYPTCSSYMLESIDNYGAIKGLGLGIKRILKCRPFGKYGYDPVPLNKGDRKWKELQDF